MDFGDEHHTMAMKRCVLFEDDDAHQLVAQAAASDPDAWEAIFRRSHGRLFAFARRRTSSEDAAQDAVSETMVRALENIDRYRWDGAGFDAWLFGILRNVVLEGYRAQRRAQRDRSFVFDHAVRGDGPLEHVVGRAEADRVRASFARLTLDEQEVLELRVVAGLSSDGAASVLGKTPGAVRMAQARALARLRVMMEEVGHDN